MMVSFLLSFFPRDVLDEILNLIMSVSEGFPTYSCTVFSRSIYIEKFTDSEKQEGTAVNDLVSTEKEEDRLAIPLDPKPIRMYNTKLTKDGVS